MYGPDENLTPEEEKRLASIRYILRRRGRANKQRSNSGAPVKSWAEYSEVNFTPDGDSSYWKYASAAIILVLLAALPFGFSAHDPEAWHQMPIWLNVIVVVVGLILLAGALAFVFVVTAACWRGLSALLKLDR